MINPDRSVIRSAFAALLTAALTGTGKPVQTVKAFRWGGIAGESPVVVISSAGTLRTRLTFQGTVPSHHLQLDTFVLYSVEGDPNYTEADAENLLDLIEKTIAQVIDGNQVTPNWDCITQAGTSVREDIQIAGNEYIREYSLLEFT